jgi:hypothetical protein
MRLSAMAASEELVVLSDVAKTNLNQRWGLFKRGLEKTKIGRAADRDCGTALE